MKGSKTRRTRGRALTALLGFAVTAIVVALPAGAVASEEAARHSTSSFWQSSGALEAAELPAASTIEPNRFRSFTLDRSDLAAALADAPGEAGRSSVEPLVLSLPAPGGGFQRFALEDSPVMEPALAKKHPDIKTYRGRGLDDRRATIRADLTPLGFHASVRSPGGVWYIDPANHLDDSLYLSYYARDLENSHGTFVERDDTTGSSEDLAGLIGDAAVAGPATGPQLRTYRLALVTDPTYATFFGGPANVTPAKVTLVNRVTQIYEDETSIRMILIGNNDLLNLDTEAKMTRGNGPCGEVPCYTPALGTSCGGATLTRTRIVIGQIIGAANYDVGHIGLGNPGGGVAALGVVGGNNKAQGCTGLSAPVGDYFAVDYVAHEIGHQFAGNHTFNGTQGSCAGGNRNAANSVEVGSGSSIQAYAGICRQDDIQAHSDPYWSQRSFEEITALVTGDRPAINEVQTASLDDFSGGLNEVQTVALSSYGGTDSFQLQYNGSNSVPIVNGTNYNAAGIKAAIETIPGWPAGGTVTVTAIGNPAGAPTTAGFDVIFGGTLDSTDVSPLAVVNGVGATGTVTETFNGGPTNDSFTLNYNGTNTSPIVHGTNYTLAAMQAELQGLSEVQTVSLAGYDADGDSFTLSYNGGTTVPIVRGQNNTVAGIQNAIQGGNEQQQVILGSFNGTTQSFQVQIGGNNSAVLGAGGLAISNANVAAAINAIPGFAGTVTSAGAGNTGFTLTFAGASANIDVPSVSIVNCTAPCTSSVRETAKGGGPMTGWPTGGTVAVSGLSDAGFTLTFSGAHQGTDVAPFSVTNETGGTTGAVAETVKGTAGVLPAGATAAVAAWGGAGALNDAGFQVTFGGNLGLIDVNALTLTNLNGLTGFFGETAQGGPIENKGFTITSTGNSAPVVTAPAGYTIPTRTPFSLTGSATDPDGDALTYMWEQNDRGGATGTALVNANKVDGPLFRQFGTPQDASVYNPAAYNSPGENHPTAADRTRVFPNLPQILADNTNAETGNCPGPPIPAPPPSGTNVPQPQIDCYSEFLPTAAWVGFTADRTMHFRFTARDGDGGVASPATDTAVVVAQAAGPFLVTSHAADQTVAGSSLQTVTWDVAGTTAAPVNTANVRISLSTDGGFTYPHTLAPSTANDGSESVSLPNVGTTQGRIRIEAVGNVFFDISDGNLTIQAVLELSSSQDSATTEYSDPLRPSLTVTASDPDTPGSSLNATASGLPAGMSLEVVSTSAGATVPGTRTWRIAGTATGPPGTYAVTIDVTDNQGHVATQALTITVTPADARATYTGDTLEYTRGSGRNVTLRASVVDGAVGSASVDDTPGDIRKATVTFLEEGRVLCGPLPVEATNAENTTGTAACTATLVAGAHDIEVSVGDHYRATTAALVRVRRAASCTVSVQPERLFAGRQTRVRAAVRLSGARYGDARVRFRGPGLDRTVAANGSGVATLSVRPARPGMLRVDVRPDEATLGCRDAARIRAASGTAGASTGGAGLTGRPLR